MKVSLQVDSGWYISDSEGLAYRNTINLYPSNPMAQGASSSGGLFSIPGTKEFASGTSIVSAAHVFNDELYYCDVSNLYKVDSAGTVTTIGALNTGALAGNAIMANNGVTLCIVFPVVNKSYFYDATNGLVQITDTVFQDYEAESGGVTSVAFIDGYFAFTTDETLFISSLVTTNNGQSFDALDFVKPFLRESAIRCAEINGSLYVFGANQTKTYSNIGGSDFPLQEIPGATFNKGLSNRFGLEIFDNSYFFVGGGVNELNSVWRGLGGGGIVKISTDSVDSYADPLYPGDFGMNESASSFMFKGRPFVGFKATNGAIFWYDVLTSAMSQMPSWVFINSSDISGTIIECYGKILVFGSSSIRELDIDELSPTARNYSFSSAYLQNQGDGLFINRLELVMDTGIGLDPNTSISYTDPEITLETSKDGGKTWVSRGSRKAGKYQKYETRLVWNRLNRTPRSTIFRFSCNTGVPLRFRRIDVDMEGGSR